MTHTPGPWRLITTRKEHDPDYNWHEIVTTGRNPNADPDQDAIAEVFETKSDGIFDPEGEANARLIAAAPELLTELIALRKRFHAACRATGSDDEFVAGSTPGADAAITKATSA